MIEIIRRWTCDEEGCDSVMELTRHGLPSSWMWLTRKGETQSVCWECSEKLKNQGWGVAKREATQLTKIPGQFIAEQNAPETRTEGDSRPPDGFRGSGTG